MRKAAINRIADEKVIADIAKSEKNEYVLLTCIEKLTDQVLNAEIAKQITTNYETLVFGKITDVGLLSDIAKKAVDPGIRSYARWEIERIRKSKNK